MYTGSHIIKMIYINIYKAIYTDAGRVCKRYLGIAKKLNKMC